jgi:hypothetical protein
VGLWITSLIGGSSSSRIGFGRYLVALLVGLITSFTGGGLLPATPSYLFPFLPPPPPPDAAAGLDDALFILALLWSTSRRQHLGGSLSASDQRGPCRWIISSCCWNDHRRRCWDEDEEVLILL